MTLSDKVKAREDRLNKLWEEIQPLVLKDIEYDLYVLKITEENLHNYHRRSRRYIRS